VKLATFSARGTPLAEYLPPCASHTKPQCAQDHRGGAELLSPERPRRSERSTHRHAPQAPPLRSKKRDIPIEQRFCVGVKTYGVRKATIRSIGFETSDVRPCRAPACTAMQAKKITLGIHDTINPSTNPVIAVPYPVKRPAKVNTKSQFPFQDVRYATTHTQDLGGDHLLRCDKLAASANEVPRRSAKRPARSSWLPRQARRRRTG
jgi:hypothetical protein